MSSAEDGDTIEQKRISFELHYTVREREFSRSSNLARFEQLHHKMSKNCLLLVAIVGKWLHVYRGDTPLEKVKGNERKREQERRRHDTTSERNFLYTHTESDPSSKPPPIPTQQRLLTIRAHTSEKKKKNKQLAAYF